MGNRLEISGTVGYDQFGHVIDLMHGLVRQHTGTPIKLDFSGVRHVIPGPMAAVCAACCKHRHNGVETLLTLPTEGRLKNLFYNAGWANLIDPEKYDTSHFTDYTHVPACQFATATQQNELVNRTLEAVLRSAKGLERNDLAAMEWALNEIMDNVIVHAQSPVGGIAHLNNFAKQRRVEIVVADPGIGIPRSLRRGHPEITNDALALEEAVKEGVTRDKAVGQGNGLYGALRISQVSEDRFSIFSGQAKVDLQGGQLRFATTGRKHYGTLVVAGINYSEHVSLSEALRFGGKSFVPTDYIELKYEGDDDDPVRFSIAAEAVSVGSRRAGAPVRNKLLNIYRMARRKRIIVDFSGVPITSSSFADEVIGKLFVELGPMEFMSVFSIHGANPTVQQLVNRAILQRSTVD